MIFNMVGGGTGGAGGGATLVVSSPANVSVTVSKDDKSYTKNSGSLGSTTFKGLATGTWTVTISGNGQTATKTIVITADYAITIAFFSATISITYPATSTCVVTNSNGQTVASDTNSTSSEKTFTATVNATGTYTVTATATDGSGKSKSQSVSITAEGQAENVTLTYELYLFSEIDGNVGDWVADNAVTITSTYMTIDDAGDSRAHTRDKVDLSMYNTLYIDAQREAGGAWTQAYIAPSDTTLLGSDTGVNFGTSTTRTTVKLDISSYNGSFYVCLLGHWTVCKIFNIWLGFETEVLKEAI